MRPTAFRFLPWIVIAGGLTSAQDSGTTPAKPTPAPNPAPASDSTGIPQPPVVAPTPNLTPKLSTGPIGNVIGNPIQTSDVTQAGNANQGTKPTSTKFRAYIGTYTNSKAKSEGIYLAELDTATGQMTAPTAAAKTNNPSFLAIHPSKKYLYAANEVGQSGGKPSGAVSGFAIDPKTGGLSPLNSEPSGGADPCYVAVDATGSDVLVANYTGGSVSVLPIGEDGKLSPPTETIQHQGRSADGSKPATPHAHSVDLDSTNGTAVVADLGLDKLMVYRFDPKSGTLRTNLPPFATLPPGSGPRHLAFAPDGRHAYVINETSCTITVFDYDSAQGSFSALQTISTRPDPVKPGDSTAEIVVHPSGRFVYGSNRGPNTLAIYTVDPASGKLTSVGYQPTGGKTPRNFAIDPTGQLLLAANQNSDTICVFKIDQVKGSLTPIGEPVPCPSPVCIRFLPILPE